jgi:hypothetical protein
LKNKGQAIAGKRFSLQENPPVKINLTGGFSCLPYLPHLLAGGQA